MQVNDYEHFLIIVNIYGNGIQYLLSFITFLSRVNVVLRPVRPNVNGMDLVTLLAFTHFKCIRNQALSQLKVQVLAKLDLRDSVQTKPPLVYQNRNICKRKGWYRSFVQVRILVKFVSKN